ncbi:glycosyltransferase family 4 protein [Marispirochaeta sp.]|uniref:glycosyltransferase family 4 protein n=1 Tax=Marispirochaeta sp. TaxID=2038653 RepID=UPI0029C660E2|nr:glycosyltransferase family 4 protein [Marispirochaeta sp.]
MTILGIFLNNEIRTGGHRRYLELLEDLAEKGHRVLVLLNEDLDYAPKSFNEVRLKARYVRRSFPPASTVFRTSVRRNLGKIITAASNVDWILIHGETHLLTAVFLKRQLGCKLLFGIRSNVVRWSSISMRENRLRPLAFFSALKEHLTYRIYEKIAAKNADKLAFQSTYDQNDFIERAPKGKEKTVIIGGNIGEPRFKPEHRNINSSTTLKKLLFVGTLGERKGLRYLLEALSILRERGIDNLELDVLGRNTDDTVHSVFAAEHGLQNQVRFQGRVADPFPFYASSDLLVVPSLFDSYPDTIIEALHTGTPVIASRVGGMPDQLAYNELLFPPRDSRALADILGELTRNPDTYLRLRELCARRQKAFHFDWAQKWEEAMKKII